MQILVFRLLRFESILATSKTTSKQAYIHLICIGEHKNEMMTWWNDVIARNSDPFHNIYFVSFVIVIFFCFLLFFILSNVSRFEEDDVCSDASPIITAEIGRKFLNLLVKLVMVNITCLYFVFISLLLYNGLSYHSLTDWIINIKSSIKWMAKWFAKLFT